VKKQDNARPWGQDAHAKVCFFSSLLLWVDRCITSLSNDDIFTPSFSVL
jgi:hypothetical protein